MALLLRLVGLRPRVAASEPAQNDAKAASGSEPVDPWANPIWLTAVMKDMRSLLQRTGSLLGAAATVLLSGLGYTQLHNIFPIPQNVPGWTQPVLCVAVVFGFGGAAWLAAIFFMAQRPILIATNKRDDLHGQDNEVADRVEGDYARQEDAVDLRGVELRALRLASLARELAAVDAQRAKPVKDESDRLFAVVHLALVRTAATILEYRSKRAFRGWRTMLALVLAVAGIVGIFGMSDYYKGQRDLYQSRVKCAQAEAVGVVGACAPFETPSQTKQRHAAEAKLEKKAAVSGCCGSRQPQFNPATSADSSSDVRNRDCGPAKERPAEQPRPAAGGRALRRSALSFSSARCRSHACSASPAFR